MLKNIFLLAFSLLFINPVFAGSEDWDGKFFVKNGGEQTVIHTSKYVQFSFIRSKHIHFSKGSRINDMTFSQDIDLSTEMNITTFTEEVRKIGIILNKSIHVGPSYND